MKKSTLFLAKDEQELFSRLPASIRDGWKIEPETGTAYEDARILKINAGIARFDSYPKLKALADEAVRTGKLDPAVLREIPESVLPELFFTIGATGVRGLIIIMLAKAANDDDVMAVSALTAIRHDLLQTNASISYKHS